MIWYGGDYNPEQWPESVWPEDIDLMRRAGVTLATVGVFSWARIQPAEGEFDFDWLDRVIGLLDDGGIKVCLATATASPPPWATTRYPGMLTENRDGATRWPGSRQHQAPTSPDYSRLATELVTAIVDRYRDHPAVAMWHINNELGCHLTYDYSDRAAAAFRTWLRARYGDIDALNDAWGTWFWSQRYTDFEQIVPPRLAPYSVNPGGLLDFRRFSSDALLDLLRMEKKIIRDAGATQPLTTNFIGAWPTTDYWRFAEEVDFVSDDCYPDPRDPESFRHAAFARDLMRSLKPGTPWILMEQAPNAVNWRPNNAPKAPGQMAALSMQAVARGADGVLFFQWRQAAAGAEKFHSAMLPHAGADTRTYREVAALGAELSTLELPAPGGEARVAIVFDWESWWAVDQPDHPAAFDYHAQVLGWHNTFHELNVQVDLVRSGGPFDGYALVVAPSLYLLRDADAEALTAFVAGGGSLLATPFTDVVDEYDRFLPGGFTTRLGPALGLSVLEFEGVLPSDGRAFVWDGVSYPADVLVEAVRLEGAQVMAAFAPTDQPGGEARPALTRHAHGSGEAWYLATMADRAGRLAVARHLVGRAGVEPVVAGLPPRVEAAARGGVVTLINHGSAPVTLPDRSVLAPYGYRILHQ
ncbi:beta-galactosidase [Virgisporangium ochraceum]|uniref:Beta-galactosidase n=1 Tax=Virgisporangium ochraceum TaxID=65505 RepID=A0A8J4EF19_9ACTN|nr:beta-galactosidase [Virgisporangium ochraceum]GIJ72354.1 beta-galactosidase [Virgisporangium ochraceum]